MATAIMREQMNGSGRKGSTGLMMVEGLRVETESYKSIASAKSRSINQKEFSTAAQPGRYKTRRGEKNEQMSFRCQLTSGPSRVKVRKGFSK